MFVVAAPFALAAAEAAEERKAAPFDVGAVIRRAHFSFRQEGERFTGGH